MTPGARVRERELVLCAVGRDIQISTQNGEDTIGMQSAEPGRKTPYSPDIGWRVVWQRLGMEMQFRDIANRLQIATSTAHRIFKRFEETGDVTASKQSRRLHARKLDEHHELLIIAMVMENPCVYLREVCQRIEEATHVRVSGSTICRILRKNGYTRKKVQQVARQRSVEYRAAFMAQVLQYEPGYFVWVDETGSDAKNHIRKFGYALCGQPPIYHRFLARGKRISAIAAISCEGLVGVELTTGSVNAEKFLEFVQGTLIPEMEPFDGSKKKSIVVLDNCSIHHARLVKDALEDAGILVIYLPPYSPDLNPIEEAFSYIKYYLKDHDEVLQVVTQPTAIIQAAFNSITVQQCKGWIKDSGYC